MPKKKLENHEYPTTAENEKTLKHLQETFANRIDPDVVYFILSERDYDLDSTLQALLTISNEIQEQDLKPDPQNETNSGEILRLSEILNSDVKPPPCCTSPETCRLDRIELRRPSTPETLYAGSTGLYQSNESLYTVEVAPDKTNQNSFALDYELTSPDKQKALTRQCRAHTPSEKLNSIANGALSPLSDCSIEADASDIMHSSLERSINLTAAAHESRMEIQLRTNEESQFNPSEITNAFPLVTSRPFYYFPFVASKVGSIHQFPFCSPQPTNYSSPKILPRPTEIRPPPTEIRPPPIEPRRRKMSPVDRVLEMQRTDDKLLILLRGLPGSGKSTLAAKLSAQNGVVCSSDMFFTHRGIYAFDASRLGEAHEWNQQRAKKFMEEGKALIVIDNTNVEAWEMKPYVTYGQKHAYRVEIVEPDTPWKFKPNELAMRNVHGITREKIQLMLDRYDKNLSVDSILGNSERRVYAPRKEISSSVVVDETKRCPKEDAKNDSSYRDSPRISPSREHVPARPAKVSASSEVASPPASLEMCFRSPAQSPPASLDACSRSPAKVYVETVNFNERSTVKQGSVKQVDKRHPKVQNAAAKSKKAAKICPKPMSATASSTSRHMECQTVRDADFRKNALDSLKDDYVYEDEEFWGFDDKSASKLKNASSPHRARCRTRQSKGDPRAMGEIARANIVVHDISLMGSDECCDDVERKSEEPRETREIDPSGNKKTKTKTKMVASFQFPFVQYSGRWCETECEIYRQDSDPRVTPRDGFSKGRENDEFSGLKELFPQVPEKKLAGLIAKCEGDVEWASNFLLDFNKDEAIVEEPKRELSHVNAAIDEALTLIDRGSELIDDATVTDLDVKSRCDGVSETSNVGLDERKLMEMPYEGRLDEDEVVCQLEPAFASQLERLFGPPSHSDESCARDLEIKINLNLAWQIHTCWAKSVQRRLYEEDCDFVRQLEESENPRRGLERHKRALSLDRKRSRSCDMGDSRHQPHRMEKTDSVPNMRDIMDSELALQMSGEDATTKVNSMWNDVDLATKMKRKLLYERYPFLDTNSLDEVFASNNFSLLQTEEQIQSAFGGELPQRRQNHVRATNGEVQRSGLVRKVSTVQSPGRCCDTFLTPVAEEVQDFRAESVLYHQLRQECFSKAKEAYHSGKRGAASFYAQEGHAYTEKIWDANRHASMKILVHRNLGRDRNTIDLHLLYVREALEMLEIFLKLKLEELMNTSDRRLVIAVITGRGKHSVDQVPRLKRGVIHYLCKKNITYQEKHAGLIEVVLTRKQRI